MDNKIAAIIAVCAVVIVLGGAILGLALGGFEVNNDDDYVIYYGNGAKTTNGETVMKSTSTEVVGGGLFDDTSKYFLIWNTQADGKGTSYTPGSEAKLGTKLYAIWGDHCLKPESLSMAALWVGLSLSISDDISGEGKVRPVTLPTGLSNKGVVVIVITGWTSVEKVDDDTLRGTTPLSPYSGTFDLDLTVENANDYVLKVDSNAAYLAISYDKDVTVKGSTSTST